MDRQRTIRTAIERSGSRCYALVAERDGVLDYAATSPLGLTFVLREVTEAEPEDYSQLATMIAQGDFTRAAIVYTNEDQPHLSDEIPTYPISRIDELVRYLSEESDPP